MSPLFKKFDLKKNQLAGLGLKNVKEDAINLCQTEDLEKCLSVCKSIVRDKSISKKFVESKKWNETSTNEADNKPSKVTEKYFINFLFRNL